MGLLILLYPFAELYAFFKFIDVYSFLDALLAVVFSGAVGSLIMRLQGKATILLFQTEVAQGRLPANRIFHRAVVFLGGLFLFIPGFLSDVMGVLFILPGTRHLVVWYLKSLLKKGVMKGRVFMGGFGMPGDFDFRRQRPGGPFPRPGQDWNEPRVERDAQVIDVEPIEITHTKKDPNS